MSVTECTRLVRLPPASAAASLSQARSLMLSLCFDAGEEVIGLTPAELQQAAERIQSGGQYVFEPQALAKVVALHTAAKAITPHKLVADLLRWLLPPLLVFAAAYWFLAHS